MRILANGIQTAFELSGREDASVVMLSHSLGSSMIMWGPQIKVLEEDFRVLRYDTRGHGGTEAPEGPYSLEMLGQDLIALLDALGIGRVHLVGLSMGGMIAQEVALAEPQRLLSLVLCDTAAVLPQDAQPVWEERIERARREGLSALVDETMGRWFTRDYLAQWPPEVEMIRRQFLATPVTGYIGCSEAIRRLNYLHRLDQIKIPTLIMVGEDDPGTPVSAARAIQERIAGSRLEILPCAAHLSNIEQAAVFNRALLGFLRGIA